MVPFISSGFVPAQINALAIISETSIYLRLIPASPKVVEGNQEIWVEGGNWRSLPCLQTHGLECEAYTTNESVSTTLGEGLMVVQERGNTHR